jgi:hypothetical protein
MLYSFSWPLLAIRVVPAMTVSDEGAVDCREYCRT